jgi:phosphohistidine phosphatase
MKLYFVRHATASAKSGWDDNDDLRPLTTGGRERFQTAATALVSAGALRPDLIVTSPLVRACQTADLLARALPGKTPVVEDSRLGHGFDLASLSALLAEHSDVAALAIVGHNPGFASVLSAVVGEADLDVRKGSVALVEMGDAAETTGTLMWLAPPALFRSRG